jgi:ceramide synthetase
MGALAKCGVWGYCAGLVIVGYRWVGWAHARRETHPNYPRFGVLYTAALLGILFTLTQFVVRYVLRPVAGMLVVKKAKWSPEVHEVKLRRFGSASFKALFFSVFTSYTYWTVLGDASWLPPAMFGKGSTQNCWGVGNAGDTQAPPGDAFTFYYQIAIAYHCSELAFQIIFELDKPDFTEMMIHHSTTCFLLIVSFFMNYVRVGSLVLFLHDISDIPVYFTKMFVDTPYKIVTFIFYLGMLVSWGYLRLYVFPAYVIRSVLYETTEEISVQGNLIQCYGFSAALSLLLCLHVYWYFKFLQMGWVFLGKGETRDLQANISSMDMRGKKRE